MYTKDIEMKKNLLYGKNRRNKGFTLVEMIVTLVVLSIVLSLSVFGLLSWQDWAEFKRENEYAQILYIAAQNQLTEYSADGRLKELQESLAGDSLDEELGGSEKRYDAVGLNITDSVSQLKDSNGESYSLADIFPESADKQTPALYQDEIVSLRAETGEYMKYLADPDGFKETDPEAYWVFELLGSYVYDSSILNGSKQENGGGNGAAVCIEITPEDGQVFSVLYSDRNDRFIYLGIADEKGSAEAANVRDIANRSEIYRKERMIGYYGVDTLYAATNSVILQPSLASVKLYNKDTFYMTYRLTPEYKTTLTSQLTYVMDLDASKNVNDKKLTITLDGTKLKNEEHATNINCPVSRYDESGSKIELGEFPVLAWVEEDYTIHVILDAADIQATTDLYERELDEIRSADKVSDTKFAKTYSFFRFGVDIGDVYASVTATGAGFIPSKTISNFGNIVVFKNQGEKHTTFAGERMKEAEEGTGVTYSIRNARHLYNIRYIEDLSYEKEAGNTEEVKSIAGTTFILKSNIDWNEFKTKGQLYNSYSTSGNIQLSSLNNRIVDENGNYIENVNRYNCDFPSFSQVRAKDIIDGNNHRISGIAVSEISNALYGIYIREENGAYLLSNNRPTGLVNVNYGLIKDLNLDEVRAYGCDFVGGFCGINAGEVDNLTTENTKDTSLISGRQHVGGVIGLQLPSVEEVEIGNLTNYAQVNGVEAVGGILGMIRNNFEFEGIDWTELTGLSEKTKLLLQNPAEFTITVRKCRNYGAVAGVNTSELRGIYTGATSKEVKVQKTDFLNRAENEAEEPRYIGGIAGYCYNRDVSDTSKVTIEDCISSPQYKYETLLSILSDKTKLNDRLKGVYVGGITGYNYFGEINNNSTKSQSGTEGYLFGYRYVGGIVGFNIGPASGIVGSSTTKQGKNDNHVIAYEYAGGITGCNSNVRDIDSEGYDISSTEAKDPEKLSGILVPDTARDLHVKIDNWINKGIVIAVHEYSGGITGYNAGYIYRCNSEVTSNTADTYFNKLYSGNYAGGIAGYNNGIIGNTQREISADGKTGIIVEEGQKLSTVCYVKGHHYVGGIVGYNDVDSIVENYEIGSGYVLGDEGSCFVGGYAGLNASVDLLMNTSLQEPVARRIYSNPNRVEGSYFVGGNIGANIINMADNADVQEINGVFMTDNFLGILEGKAFVGGFVGYNLLFDNPAQITDWILTDPEQYRGGVYIIQRELTDAFEKSDTSASNTENALIEKKKILDNLSSRLGFNINASDVCMNISGQGTESTKVSFGTISGNIYVGGVLGYNDKNTRLLIQNVENTTPIEATEAIMYPEEQVLLVNESTGEKVYRTKDYIGNDIDYTYSYAGGIIGKVSKYTTLDNCWNASSGTVTVKGTYTGGLCEINEGVIQNCAVTNFGNSVTNYLGGLCGLNKNKIENCIFQKKTVSGCNVVGGITAENFGTISNVILNGAKLLVEGVQTESGNRDGVAGIYTGYNGSTGRILLQSDISDIMITSGGRYVGAATGINDGMVLSQKVDSPTDTGANVVISGTIRGYQTVGGLIGMNQNEDASIVIEHFTNQASVLAINGSAGGIIGENQSENAIQYCVNDGTVIASDAGNAGGITSVNQGAIQYCYDYKSVGAPEGMCGGIVAINGKEGSIRNCYIEPKDGTAKLVFRSTKAVGAVAAQNAGEIASNDLKYILVTNETTVLGTSIGIVVGDNLADGRIYVSDSSNPDTIENCKAVVQSNYCRVGGIAGTNAGRIQGTLSETTGDIMSVVNCCLEMDKASIASMGGVAGTNTGTIYAVAVDAEIQGDLGSSVTGYGGVAGYSGYSNRTDSSMAQEESNGEEYPVSITNCSFDGIINATGSSGAPVRIGGIVGINGYGSKVEECYVGTRVTDVHGEQNDASAVTYVTAGDYINKTSESVSKTDTKSYSYLGGIAGGNYGCISACDNEKHSSDTVNIIGFSGESGGIAGYNYKYGVISGYYNSDDKSEHYLSTGKKWMVEQRCCGNDRGPGGIIGMCESGEDMSYVKNYASVTCKYQSNSYVAGLIGLLNQGCVQKPVFYKCDNYGDVYSFRSAGGLIGMVKSNGAIFSECKNYGNVYAKDRSAGGFVAMHHSFVVGLDFRHCENHGSISSRGVVGGFVGTEQYNHANVDSYMYDCVNTGIILRENQSSVSSNAGHFYGQGKSKIYMELCRNYNTYTRCANGFVGNGSAYLKNCFDDSNNVTTNSAKTPFGGGTNNSANAYYLDQNSGSRFSHKNYGVYFTLHQGSNDNKSYADLKFNNFLYKELRDTSVYFSEPDISNQIKMGARNPRLKISLTYDDNSQGIDSFVLYFWNGKTNTGTAPAGNYSCKATYIFEDGSKYETEAVSADGYFEVCDNSRVVLKNHSDNKKPISIQLDFTGNTPVCLRGFSYIPVEESDTEAVCTYLSQRNGTAFSIEKLQVAGGSPKTSFEIGSKTKPVTDTLYGEYPNDVLDIDWEAYTHYGLYCNSGQVAEITFSVVNEEYSTGMDSFVFYLANANTSAGAAQKDRTTIYYNYYVTFTDINGNSVDTALVKNAAGYDAGEDNYKEKSRQLVQVPEELNAKIETIVLHIQPTNHNRVLFRGFDWIPQGQTKEQKMAAYIHSGATRNITDRDVKDGSISLTHLLVDDKGSSSYVYLPYNYRKGFYMSSEENDPIGSTYYEDHDDYGVSLTETRSSGSRIDIYSDIDSKFVELSEDACTVYTKLSMPANLHLEEADACITYAWSRVLNAYAYEIRYQIKEENGKVVFDSGVTSIGSTQTTYDVEVDESWAKQNYRIIFYVRAINGYHPAHDDMTADDYDENYDKYDSDWVTVSDSVIKNPLPKPQIHIEIIAGNRATFVLDNYDDYVERECTDCTIYMTYKNLQYTWNVAEEGKYYTPVQISCEANNALTKFVCYAKPNEGLEDSYISSAIDSQMGEGHGNDILDKRSSYCDTLFNGFYGTEADNMEYQVIFTLNSLDVYLMTDISAYDETIGATVVYDSEITHAANSYSGGGKLKLTSTLKNLPEEWFASDKVPKVTVRAYPYHSQFDIIHYGHDVAEGIRLDGTVEENRAVLKNIYDNAYFAAESDAPIRNSIWDETANDLKSGYLLQKQEDGTYNVIYSSLVELSQTAAKQQREENGEAYREYYMYDVYYRIYSDMETETAGQIKVNSADFQESYWSRGMRDNNTDNYNTVITNNIGRKYIQQIQPAPIAEDEVVSGVDANGCTEYTFKWDTYYQDTACWHPGYQRYQFSQLNSLTNAEQTGLVNTWDEFYKKLSQAGLSESDMESYKTMVNLMNYYYYNYSTAAYRVDFIGTTLDGKEVILDTTTVDSPTALGTISSYEDSAGVIHNLTTRDGVTPTTYNMWDYECTFTDSDGVWGTYPKLTARIMRLGSLKSVKVANTSAQNGGLTDPNGATYVLPRYTDKSIQVKLQMNTISKPEVTLLKEDGKFITSDLIYQIKWGSITDKNQKKDLGGYLITVTLLTAGQEGQITEPHYYYVTDIGTAGDTIGLDIEALDRIGTVTDVTGDYTKSKNVCQTRINLADFNTNDIIEISVKAIARSNSDFYTDSADGVSTELAIPKRLKTPDTEKLSGELLNYSNDAVVDMTTYQNGWSFRYANNEYTDERDAEIHMAVAVYDAKPVEAQDDTSLVLSSFDEGALATLYPKDNAFSLGKVSEGQSDFLKISKFEKYPGEYAGKWLKIALQARCATKIDSQWTDKDQAGKTKNYIWVQIPKLQLDDVNLTELATGDSEEPMSAVARYFYDGRLYDESQNSNRETRITCKTLCFHEDKNVNDYSIHIVGRQEALATDAPVYDIYLQRHMITDGAEAIFDGTWDVYLKTNGQSGVGGQTENHPVCEQSEDAVWIGRMGIPFDTTAKDGEGEKILTMEDISNSVEIGSGVRCDITAQLRYMTDDTGAGSFLLVLPDVTMLGEMECDNTNYYTEQVTVHQYVKEGSAYITGADGIYRRNASVTGGAAFTGSRSQRRRTYEATR